VTSPPAEVLAAFGLADEPVPLPGGQGGAWRVGRAIVKPLDLSLEELAWQADLLPAIRCDGFRVARPLRAVDGSLSVGGWCAWERLEGRHEPRRWPDVIAVGERFHAALEGRSRPRFLDARTDPWAIGDRVAWGELPAHEFAHVKHVPRLLAGLEPVDAPAQLVHGDLTGNVLFGPGLAPGIIDLAPYWRPPAFATAIVVADALVREGADATLLDGVAHVEAFEQYLLRALVYRAVTDRLARPGEPIRPDHDDPYLQVVELALALL
jgi:uncharacterized protein (TIGR02569 family)